ncbi:6-carboxytetrahydropterin synthase QueD [bacterium]|nr:6-carboxytetrahydropterin synthase QueD [bacterium]
MFEITVEKEFAAAHRLREYDGNCENLHGHNWHIELTIGATELNSLGLAVDFREVRAWLNNAIKSFDHAYLNELEAFRDINPSCEIIARIIFNRVKNTIKNNATESKLFVVSVRVWESPGSSVTYREISEND